MNHNPKPEVQSRCFSEKRTCVIYMPNWTALSCQGVQNEKSHLCLHMTQILPSLYWGHMHALKKDRSERLCTESKEAGEGAIEEITLQSSTETVH